MPTTSDIRRVLNDREASASAPALHVVLRRIEKAELRRTRRRKAGYLASVAVLLVGLAVGVASTIGGGGSAGQANVGAGTQSSRTSPPTFSDVTPIPGTSPGTVIPERKRVASKDLTGTLSWPTSMVGKQFDLTALRGKVVVVTFWATWCSPCVTELPQLESVDKEFETKGVVMLAVDSRDSSTASAAFLRSNGITFQNIQDAAGVKGNELGVSTAGIPVTVLIDRHGRVAAVYLGPPSSPHGTVVQNMTKALTLLDAES